jgi:hypothetical protein
MSSQPYGDKSDVYSFGVIMWEFLARKAFFGELSFMSQIEEKVLISNSFRFLFPLDLCFSKLFRSWKERGLLSLNPVSRNISTSSSRLGMDRPTKGPASTRSCCDSAPSFLLTPLNSPLFPPSSSLKRSTKRSLRSDSDDRGRSASRAMKGSCPVGRAGHERHASSQRPQSSSKDTVFASCDRSLSSKYGEPTATLKSM